MAEAVVSFLLERLESLVRQEANLLFGVNNEVRQMQRELKRMQCFLKDADKRQGDDQSVKNWVSEIREAAYDVEDVIDNFIAKFVSKKGGRIRNSILHGLELHNLAKEIENIKSRIIDLTRSLKTYGITARKEGDGSRFTTDRQRQLRWSYSHVVEEHIVGFEENIKELMVKLIHEDERCRVVSICGMGECLNEEQSWELFQQKAFPGKDKPGFVVDKDKENLEDFEIPTKKLVRQWVAEGFVSLQDEVEVDERHETMEETARRYLHDLINRSMVQVGVQGSTGTIKTCRLHDLMRDLCLLKAREENFIHIIGAVPSSATSRPTSASRIRRCAIHLDHNDHDPALPEYQKNPNLRSLFFFRPKKHRIHNRRLLKSVFDKFKLLKVLDLEGIKGLEEKLPEDVGTLIQLRFLSLKKTRIKELPTSLGNLVGLQTLNLQTIDKVSWESTVQVPNILWKMEQLRHLYLPNWCGNVTDKLQLANLSNLQTLVNFPADKCDVRDLLLLTNLRKLVLNDPRHFEPFVQIFEPPNKTLPYLTSLSLKTDLLSFPDKVVDLRKLLLGCPRLCKLHVEGRIENLPRDNEFPSSLTKLTLWGSRLAEDPMEALGKLPHLKYLSGWEVFTGKKMTCSKNSFPKLKTLLLRGLPNFQEWTIEEGAMRSLSRLGISDCYKLKMVPDGLRFVTTLQELEIRWMSRAFKTNKIMECMECCYIEADALKAKRHKMMQGSWGVSLQDSSFKIIYFSC
ncbi:hypothetical protein V6N11_077096 [Hibiscus sabdariffa]|uniref:Rx N-terminal domain-containing protein n=1 Tax=Hibiscus sabdariffa TaxID=183260 RepID=A0ABR2TCQ2_9ROSI